MTDARHFVVVRELGKIPFSKGPFADGKPPFPTPYEQAVAELSAKYGDNALTLITVTEFGQVWPSTVRDFRTIRGIKCPAA